MKQDKIFEATRKAVETPLILQIQFERRRNHCAILHPKLIDWERRWAAVWVLGLF